MQLPDDARELQRIADYRTAAAVLGAVSISRIVGGVVFIALGLLGTANIFSHALIVLGVIMIGVAIGSRLAPGASWLLINAIIAISIGVVSIGMAALASIAGVPGTEALIYGGVGVLILLAGVLRLRTYSRYGPALADPATEAEVQSLTSLVRRAVRAQTDDDDVFAFRVTNPGGRREWRALLYGQAVLFVALPLKTVLAADRDNVDIDLTGKTSSGKNLEGALLLGEQRRSIVISAEALDRFDAWKADEDDGDETGTGGEAERHDDEPPTGIKPE